MKKLTIATLSALSLALATGSAVAASMQVGVVNVKQIFNSSPRVASQKQKLTSEFRGKQQQLKKSQQDLQKMIAKYKRNASVMNAAQKQQMQTQIAAQQAKVVQMSRQFQMQAMQAQEHAMKGFATKLQGAVSTVAKKHDLQLVLPKNAVIYSAGTLDITKQVEIAFNKQ